MPLSALGAVFFLLAGLGSAWVGVSLARIYRSSAPDSDSGAPPARRWSPAEAWLWRFALIAWGLGLVSLGLLDLRYGRGWDITIPARPPLIDHVISLCCLFGILGGFILLSVWALVREVGDRCASRGGSDGQRPAI